jgi:hypothetical protein
MEQWVNKENAMDVSLSQQNACNTQTWVSKRRILQKALPDQQQR